jgi:hypothetical protein
MEMDCSLARRTARMIRFVLVTTYQCAYMKLKNGFKVLIGREPYLPHVLWSRERLLFLRAFFLHICRIKPIVQITCRGLMTEGPGSQAVSNMDAIAFARSAGLVYAHTPFSYIRHADRPMKEWAAVWETMFSFGFEEVSCEDRDTISYVHASDELLLLFGLTREEINASLRAMIPKFKRKYRLNNPVSLREEIKIATHLRRGPDVSVRDPLFTKWESVLTTIQRIKHVFDDCRIPCSVSIYSEGAAADFGQMCFTEMKVSKFRVGRSSQPPIHDTTDIDAPSALRDLIEADALIMSRGSLSYCAAILSDGIKIGEPDGWHFRPHNWITCDKSGWFDERTLQPALCHRSQLRQSGIFET